jgi:hypothetical protein
MAKLIMIVALLGFGVVSFSAGHFRGLVVSRALKQVA